MSNAADRLVRIMDARSKNAGSISELTYGTVSSVSPLVITRDNGINLTSGFLVLSKTCRALSVQIQGVPVEIWPALTVGEKVILLSFSSGQRFFVERM